jgi:hypothetical protein
MKKIIALIVGVLMLLTGCSPEDEPRVIEHKCQEYQGEHEIKHLVLSESLNENQSPEYYYALYSHDLHTSFQPPSEMEFEFNGQKIHARYYSSNHPSYAYYSVYSYSGDNGERIVIDERGTIVEFWTKNIEPKTDICIGEDRAVDKAKEILGTLVDIEGYSVSVKTRESSSSYNIRFQKNVSGIETDDHANVIILFDGTFSSLTSSFLGRVSGNKEFDLVGIEKTIMSCVNSIYGDIEYEYDVNLSDPRIIITEDGEDALLYIALITIKWPYGNSYIGKHEEMDFIVL